MRLYFCTRSLDNYTGIFFAIRKTYKELGYLISQGLFKSVAGTTLGCIS